MWDVKSRKPICQQAVTMNRVALSPDGGILGAIDENSRSVILIDLANGQASHTVDGASSQLFTALAFSPDGRWFAYAGFRPNKIWLVSTETRQAQAIYETEHYCSALGFSPDSQRVAASCSQEINPTRGEWAYHTDIIDLNGKMLKQVKDGADTLSFSRNGKLLTVGGRLWDLESETQKQDFHVSSALLTADDSLILLIRHSSVQWVDSSNGAIIHKIIGQEPYVTAYSLSPDRTLFAVSSGGKMPGARSINDPHRGIRLWAVR